MTTTAPRLMTADELFNLPDDRNCHELTRGELIEVSLSAPLPGVVTARLLGKLIAWNDDRRLGVFGTAESGFKLASDPDTVRAPDAWFVRDERIPSDGIPSSGFWPGPPDLAIEVLSPTDRFVDVLRKATDYMEFGARLLWVIDPLGRSIAVYRPGVAPLLLGENDSIEGGELLPGFRFTVHELLPEY